MTNFESGEYYTKQRYTSITAPGSTLERIEFEDCVFERCVFAASTFYRCVFTDCRFVACDLSNITAPNCKLNGVTFERSKVLGVDWTLVRGESAVYLIDSLVFSECVLDYANFAGLPLRGLRLDRCHVHAAAFTEADLTGAVCTGSDFLDSIFLRTNLERADFRDAINYAIDPTANRVKGARFALPEAVALLRPFDVVIEM